MQSKKKAKTVNFLPTIRLAQSILKHEEANSSTWQRSSSLHEAVPATSSMYLRQFLEFASSFHPNFEYTWSVSTDKLPFLDICMKPQANRIATSIHYKATDSHSYLNFSSSHPYSCKSSIPYSQFLRLRKICSDDADFDIEAAKMETFLQHADIRMTSLEGEGNDHRPNQGLKFWRVTLLTTSLRLEYLLSLPSTSVTFLSRK